MRILEVNTPALHKAFLNLGPKLYAGDINYIRPLDKDVAAVFDKEKNKYFIDGEIQRFVLQKDGEIIGRIAAFIHPKIERNADQPTGGCGFFECIDDQEAANMLFDTAKQFLVGKGKEAMDGPINFGEQDKWWGCLQEGFEPPLYCMNYNPAYYCKLFENYGFQDYFKQLVYRYDLSEQPPRKFYVGYKHVKHKLKNVEIRHAKKSQLSKYAEDFRTVYNETWANTHDDFKEMTSKQVKAIMKTLKPIMVEEAMLFAYDGERPIALFISIPNLNEVVAHLNGKFNAWALVKFFYHLKIKKTPKTMASILFGVVPAYQGKGIDAGLAIEGYNELTAKGFTWAELMWIGDFNPKMMSIAEQLGCTVSKQLVTYRYLFDRQKPFARHKVINIKEKKT